MTRPVRLTAAAEEDLGDARQWYLEQAPHVDPVFRVEVRETLKRIGASPQLYPVLYREVRRALVHRFPYAVFYRVQSDAILVVAITHQARNPKVWKGRI